MSDEEYDILKEFIEDKYPNNLAIQEGHTLNVVLQLKKKKMKLPLKCGQ